MLDKANELKLKGHHNFKVSDVYQSWAVRIYLHTTNKESFRENWPLPESVFGENPMGRDKYLRLQRMWITPEAVKCLNQASEAVMTVPEVLTVDEKLMPFTGVSPWKRFVPNKDPQWGHWITQCTQKGKYTGLPFMRSSFPVQQSPAPSMLEYYQAVLSGVSLPDREKNSCCFGCILHCRRLASMAPRPGVQIPGSCQSYTLF
jgi:hypothetical protein